MGIGRERYDVRATRKRDASHAWGNPSRGGFGDADGLLAQFGTRRSRAVAAYERFVRDGIGGDSIWGGLKGQVFLGDDAFVRRMQRLAKRSDDINIPRAQRRPPPPSMASIAEKYPDRNQAVRIAWRTGAYSYAQIAEHFGVHFSTVGRAVRRGS